MGSRNSTLAWANIYPYLQLGLAPGWLVKCHRAKGLGVETPNAAGQGFKQTLLASELSTWTLCKQAAPAGGCWSHCGLREGPSLALAPSLTPPQRRLSCDYERAAGDTGSTLSPWTPTPAPWRACTTSGQHRQRIGGLPAGNQRPHPMPISEEGSRPQLLAPSSCSSEA